MNVHNTSPEINHDALGMIAERAIDLLEMKKGDALLATWQKDFDCDAHYLLASGEIVRLQEPFKPGALNVKTETADWVEVPRADIEPRIRARVRRVARLGAEV